MQTIATNQHITSSLKQLNENQGCFHSFERWGSINRKLAPSRIKFNGNNFIDKNYVRYKEEITNWLNKKKIESLKIEEEKNGTGNL